MELYQYQQEIVDVAEEILNRSNMVYLALETRTGKTFISLTLSKGSNTLFVTTKSAIKDIQEACEDLKIEEEDICIVNYESVHKIDPGEYEYVIIDEMHKIGSYPKPNLARKRLDHFIGNNTKLILMSGTPAVESNSQMFHQLSLCPTHPFAEYKSFYKWFKTFGIPGVKFIGRGITANDYTNTKDFSEYWKDITISLTREEAGFMSHTPNINKIYLDLPNALRCMYDDMKTTGVATSGPYTFVAEGGGASKLTKLQQIASGSCIDDTGVSVPISRFKVKYIQKHYSDENVAVLYKYKAEKDMLEQAGIEAYQIDSGTTGLALHHLDRLVVMTNTFSGANFIQSITRLAHRDREQDMPVDILLSRNTIEKDILDTVLEKKNFNSRMYNGAPEGEYNILYSI